jgi:DNA invertase Pin-like site-specific DNA recombinase
MEQVIKKHKDRVSAEANVKKYEELLAKDDIGHLERQRARLGEKTKDNVHSRLPLLKACVEACDPVFESPSELIAATLLNAVANENLKLIQDKSQEGLEEYEAAKKLVKARMCSACSLLFGLG